MSTPLGCGLTVPTLPHTVHYKVSIGEQQEKWHRRDSREGQPPARIKMSATVTDFFVLQNNYFLHKMFSHRILIDKNPAQ